MKKFRFIIAVMLISCIMAGSVSAHPIMPYDDGGTSANVTLSIDDGKATVAVIYNGTSDVTSTSFYVHLQKDGVNHISWQVPCSGSSASFERSVSSLPSGHTYQVEVKCYVYSKNGNFDFTAYSNSVYY